MVLQDLAFVWRNVSNWFHFWSKFYFAQISKAGKLPAVLTPLLLRILNEAERELPKANRNIVKICAVSWCVSKYFGDDNFIRKVD